MDSPAILVAILVAAKKAKDRELEKFMREKLASEHGVKVIFPKEKEGANGKP